MGVLVRRLPAALLLGLLLAPGCASRPDPTNPSFPVTLDAAEADLRRMAAAPVPLRRPLLIVTGFLDPGIAAVSLNGRFGSLTGDRRIVAVTLADCLSFEKCRKKIVAAVDRAFPEANASATGETIEVDVIGYSLGGVAARYAAQSAPQAPSPRGDSVAPVRRLRIARLFTISSPHRGAEAARRLPLLHPLQNDLRPGSAMLTRLNESVPPYPIYPYVRLGDAPVGECNASPPGRPPWWVPTPAFSDPHNGAFADPRILADIARRLRGEVPLTFEPASPLP